MNQSEKIKHLPDYMSTTDIGKNIGFHMTQNFIEETLGLPARIKTKLGSFWHKSDYPIICMMLSAHASTSFTVGRIPALCATISKGRYMKKITNLNNTKQPLEDWLEALLYRMAEMLGEGKDPVFLMDVLDGTQTLRIELLPDNVKADLKIVD